MILVNFGKEPFSVAHGDRIAQMVVSRVERVDFDEAEELSMTQRGEGGFGHTGISAVHPRTH